MVSHQKPNLTYFEFQSIEGRLKQRGSPYKNFHTVHYIKPWQIIFPILKTHLNIVDGLKMAFLYSYTLILTQAPYK